MFLAAHRSSSGAPNCICSLWFIYTCGDRPLSRLDCLHSMVVVWLRTLAITHTVKDIKSAFRAERVTSISRSAMLTDGG